MAVQYGGNKFSGKYESQRITLRRRDGTRLHVWIFSKDRGAQVSFDEQHWAPTKEAALTCAAHLYDTTWGNQIPK